MGRFSIPMACAVFRLYYFILKYQFHISIHTIHFNMHGFSMWCENVRLREYMRVSKEPTGYGWWFCCSAWYSRQVGTYNGSRKVIKYLSIYNVYTPHTSETDQRDILRLFIYRNIRSLAASSLHWRILFLVFTYYTKLKLISYNEIMCMRYSYPCS